MKERTEKEDKDRVEKGVRWEVVEGHTDACRDVLSKPSALTLHPTVCVASALHGALDYLMAGTNLFTSETPTAPCRGILTIRQNLRGDLLVKASHFPGEVN